MRLARYALEAGVAALGSLAVMGGSAAAGLHLLGASQATELLPAAAALGCLALGGSVNLSAALGDSGARMIAMQGGLDIMPLGVSLLGALALALGLRWTVRRHPLQTREIVLRAGVAYAVFLAGTIAMASIGTGTFDAPDLSLRQGSAGGVSLAFDTNVGVTVIGATAWFVLTATIGFLTRCKIEHPGRLGHVWRQLKPVCTAVVDCGLVLVALAICVGAVVGLSGRVGDVVPGFVVLAVPGAVILALTLGAGVPWTATTSGPLAEILPLDRVLGDGQSISLGSLAAAGNPSWVGLLVVWAGFLLACGLLAARRFPTRGGIRTAAANGVRLGLVLAVGLPLGVSATRLTAQLGVSLLGNQLAATTLALEGDLLVAAASGAFGGFVAGTIGALLVRPKLVSSGAMRWRTE